jgi:hypothetical protein
MAARDWGLFVGNRGMVTSDNLDDLREHGHGYIVGCNRRRSGEVFDYIQSATGPWIECPAGITAQMQQYHHELCPYVLAKIAPPNQQNQRFATCHHPGYVKHGLARKLK